jgi:hypothetical protein
LKERLRKREEKETERVDQNLLELKKYMEENDEISWRPTKKSSKNLIQSFNVEKMNRSIFLFSMKNVGFEIWFHNFVSSSNKKVISPKALVSFNAFLRLVGQR